MSNYKTSEYYSWTNMKTRCYNINNEAYKNYGARGIKVCGRWLNSFENFLEDMGPRPKGKTLDRIDNNKGYSKQNCKWSTPSEQSENRRNKYLKTYKGETENLKYFSKKYNVPYGRLCRRVRVFNWSIEEALETPKVKNQYHRKETK